MKKKKRGETSGVAIFICVLIVLVIIATVTFVYMSINGYNYTTEYDQKIQTGEIKNPVDEFGEFGINENLSITLENNTLEGQDKYMIQSSIIRYASVVLKLYNLHNIPFTGITPKIQVYVDEDPYFIEIVEGDIIIKPEETSEPDIIIRTTNEEMLKMSKSSDYAKESISSGATTIEEVASKAVLFSKGYLSLYEELNMMSNSS